MKTIHSVISNLSMRSLSVMLFTISLYCSTVAQQGTGVLRGTMKDQLGAVIVGATVTVSTADGTKRSSQTDTQGLYEFGSLRPGTYRLSAEAKGFASYERPEVLVSANRTARLDIEMTVAIREEVTVGQSGSLNTNAEEGPGSIVLRGQDLESLPDDPDELAAALSALAGPGAGPSGGAIYVDGMLATRPPPRNSISEVRITSNPWSAEYDRVGVARIDIVTRPGTDSIHWRVFFGFNDESMNARNPFAPNRAPYQLWQYGGTLSGPLIKRKASYFLDFDRRQIDDNAVVNAIVLDPLLRIVPFSRAVVTPQSLNNLSVRTDFQLNPTHTLVARYSYASSNFPITGIGEFLLPERAFRSSNNEHSLNLSDNAVINKKVVSETRFQFLQRRRDQKSDNSLPAIDVLESFSGGLSPVGFANADENRWELSNLVSWSIGSHTLRVGGRVRGVRITDIAPTNFGGTFTFAGGSAVLLDSNNQIVLNPDGTPVVTQISSIERYRRTLVFQQQGLPGGVPGNLLGFGPSQLTLSRGDPRADVSQTDVGVFIQDNWVVRRDLGLSLGLRYEKQSNINSRLNFSPRLAVAWMPRRGQGEPQTVVRAGIGVFYDRFSENFTLAAKRFDGVTLEQFIIEDPLILAQFPNLPPPQLLDGLTSRVATRKVAPDLQSPYTIQFAGGVEQRLPRNTTLTLSFFNIRTLHSIRSRNINAPLPGTFAPGQPLSGVRPLGNVGNIFQYESSSNFNQQMFRAYALSRAFRNFSFYTEYVLNRIRSDVEAGAGFPANSYDLTGEYGRSSFDFRQRLLAGGTYTRWGVTFSPSLIWRASIPFNIITGRDSNGDGVFTERPAFATDLSKPGVVISPFGAFDPNPVPGQLIIPRNFGKGPSYFSTDLRITRSFGFGTITRAAPPAGRQAPPPESRYYFAVALVFSNLFNNTNPALPIGNLSSPLFGQSTATAGFYGFGTGNFAGNRRFTYQMSFRF